MRTCHRSDQRRDTARAVLTPRIGYPCRRWRSHQLIGRRTALSNAPPRPHRMPAPSARRLPGRSHRTTRREIGSSGRWHQRRLAIPMTCAEHPIGPDREGGGARLRRRRWLWCRSEPVSPQVSGLPRRSHPARPCARGRRDGPGQGEPWHGAACASTSRPCDRNPSPVLVADPKGHAVLVRGDEPHRAPRWSWPCRRRDALGDDRLVRMAFAGGAYSPP